MRYSLPVFTLIALALTTSFKANAQQLPANPDPNKCYVRIVTPDQYESTIDSVLTYSDEEAQAYEHEVIEFVVKPAVSRWESTMMKDCESGNPDDCQVLCYRTYPATIFTYFRPLDPTLGNPFLYPVERKVLVSRGGLSRYDEINCVYTDYSDFPIGFAAGSDELTPVTLQQIDTHLMPLFRAHPGVSVILQVHTDSRGDAVENLRVTEDRGRRIVEYLGGQGVDSLQVIVKCLGEEQLLNHCANDVDCTEAEHQQNNRIAFKVLLGTKPDAKARKSRVRKKRKKRN